MVRAADGPVQVKGVGEEPGLREPPPDTWSDAGPPGPCRSTGPVEHGFARLKNWRVFGKVRTDPSGRLPW
jgi:hypothetical protein